MDAYERISKAVGLLTLETDDGTIELAVNRGVSRELMELLMEFLIGPHRDEEPDEEAGQQP